MLSMLAKLLKVLNSEADPAQISLAFGFALVSGFLPLFGPLNLLVLLIVLLVRINLSAYLLGTAFFAGIAYALDPVFHPVGLAVLTAGPLEGLWTMLYGSPLGRLQRFNNSVVMGGLVVACALFVPLVLASNLLIRKYRQHVLAWVRKTRVMQLLMASRFYTLYEKLS